MLKASSIFRLHKSWVSRKQLNSKTNSEASNGMALARPCDEPTAEKRRMKSLVVLSVLMIASCGVAASAAESSYADYSDIDVISVAPRNSNVKPFVMATFTKQQLERAAAAAPKKIASSARNLVSGR
jgi:hypothetical protein